MAPVVRIELAHVMVMALLKSVRKISIQIMLTSHRGAMQLLVVAVEEEASLEE